MSPAAPPPGRPLAARLTAAWFSLLLAAAILVIYWPALRFGLIWDDPRYYAGLQARATLAEVFTQPQPPTNQFYRPLAVLQGQLLTGPEGVVNTALAHAWQIAAHLIASLALAPVLTAAGLERTHARLAALVFALYPAAYYGVAWQQNQQPQMFAWLMLALLAAARFQAGRRPLWLALSGLAYAAALLYQEGAVPFAVLFVWLAAGPDPRKWAWRDAWPLLHAALAGLYLALWFSLPLQRGVTGRGFEFIVLTYFLQGLVFPAAALLNGWIQAWGVPALAALYAGVWLALSLAVWRGGAPRAVALGWLWAGVGLLPLWAGLSWSYAELGPRLIYPAVPGLAGLWAGLMAWLFRPPAWRRAVGGLIAAAVLGVSLVQLDQAQRLFSAGTRHLTEAVTALAARPGERLVFVNFPDRIEARPRPYPLGFWGVVLAPVVQDLADFARAERGRSAADEAYAAFLTGAAEREAWPARVDMRGVNVPPEVLREAALGAGAVYLSDYLPDGSLRLREVGRLSAAAASAPLARLAGAADLVAAEAAPAGTTLTLRLTWRPAGALPVNDTIFVHLWSAGAFVAGADGDSLGELLPLYAWAPGQEVHEVRTISLAGLPPGAYEVRVGIYNRASQVRYPVEQGGQPAENGALAGAFNLP